MTHWVSKDPLGTAIWTFRIALIGMVLMIGILFEFNTLAIQAERGAPERQAAFERKADLEHEAQAAVPKKAELSVPVEALKRTWNMGGAGALLIILIAGANLAWQKRPYKIKDDPVADFVDPVAAGRKVK